MPSSTPSSSPPSTLPSTPPHPTLPTQEELLNDAQDLFANTHNALGENPGAALLGRPHPLLFNPQPHSARLHDLVWQYNLAYAPYTGLHFDPASGTIDPRQFLQPNRPQPPLRQSSREVVIVNVFDNTDNEVDSDSDESDENQDSEVAEFDPREHNETDTAGHNPDVVVDHVDSDSDDSSFSDDTSYSSPVAPRAHLGGKTIPGHVQSRVPTSAPFDDNDEILVDTSATLGDQSETVLNTSQSSLSHQNIDDHHSQDDQSDIDYDDDYASVAYSASHDSDHSDYQPSPERRVRRVRRASTTASIVSEANVDDCPVSSPLSSAPSEAESDTVEPEVNTSQETLVTDYSVDSGPDDPNMITPPNPRVPLPQVNGQNVNSSARAANTSSPHQHQSQEARRDGEKLATGLNQLQVRSPPLQPEASTSATQPSSDGPSTHASSSKPVDIPRRQESTGSTSTENSSGHPYPPSSLSDYTSEGYLKSMMPNAEEQQVDPVTTAAVQSQVSAADAAIMRLNGTSSVHTSSLDQPTPSGPFTLPGGHANFARPNNRNDTVARPVQQQHPSRQTSTSTASASTSSSEEDITLPSWTAANAVERESPVQRRTGIAGFLYHDYMPVNTQRHHASGPSTSNQANPSRGFQPSGYNGYVAEPATLPLGATAHHPQGVSDSEPMGIVNNESSGGESADDDDETVGDRSSRSKSTSEEVGVSTAISKGKRKASAAPGPERAKNVAGNKAQAGHPTKRRRSELSDSQIDPSLQDDAGDFKMESDNGDPSDGSDDEVANNSGDSDYDGPGPSRPKVKSRRAIAGRSKASTSKATSKKTKSVKASVKPSGDSGVTRCDYVSPLPPYQRCTDTFTRKYDLPRHKDRHAAIERDLVAQGKLSEDKATVWASVKNRAPIQCPTCHETFTRQDALKRHCKNQNH